METICEGCYKLAANDKCQVYAKIPHQYISHNECPFNRKDIQKEGTGWKTNPLKASKRKNKR